ncbi:transmembrane protein, putative [Bodo saltans]|uniref:Transmembrane protein, putative n=1 Tax=Bodo saltans TaxID=75058 RepID=A0A0S4KLR5_BODSA|nr:transmembrane protein, putative [Bodo saltans]|eukprot:CUI14559.1 transmembrane protein, putative [Bodo saltans]
MPTSIRICSSGCWAVGHVTRCALKRYVVVWFRLSGQHGWSWKPLDSATTLSAHRMVRTLLLEYRALWYAALDSTDVCVVAILGAIGPFLQWSACVGSGAAVVVVLALQLLVCISSNPMSRPLDWYVGCVTLALTTASSTLRIVYGASTNDDEREERGVLLIVAASLDMVVSIVTFAPIVLDVAELLRYMLCKKAHSTGGGDIDDETSSTDAWYGGRQPSIELLPLKKGSDDDLTDEINFPLACAPSDDNLNDIDVFKVTNAFLELLSSSGDDAANVADSVLETQAVGVTMMPTDLLAAYHYSNSFE